MRMSLHRPVSTPLRDRLSQLVRLLAAAAVSTSVVLAQGGFEGPGVYEILNKNSGKVVDLDRNDESTVIQFESRRTDNQQWEIRPAEQGFFFVINMMNGYALEGGRKGDPAVGRPFTGTTAQQWRFEEGRDGTVLFISREGLALDVPGDSKSSGKRLQVTSRNGSAAQRFLLRFIGEADPFGHLEDATPSAPPEPPAPPAPSTPPSPAARPAPTDAGIPYLPAPACHEAIRAEVRRQYGSEAYLIYPSAAEQWQDRGKDRLNGRATVRAGGQSEEVEYNCLGDPLERRIEWSEVRRTGSGAR